MKRKDPAWLATLDLRGRLLQWLIAAQSRYETAAIKRFGAVYSARQIRLALRELQNEKLIQLAEFDRVRWAISPSGRCEARRARERAERKMAA